MKLQAKQKGSLNIRGIFHPCPGDNAQPMPDGPPPSALKLWILQCLADIVWTTSLVNYAKIGRAHV